MTLMDKTGPSDDKYLSYKVNCYLKIDSCTGFGKTGILIFDLASVRSKFDYQTRRFS